MKKGPIFYPEEVLVEKHENGDFTWVDYISHHSEEWCDEYEAFCKENDFNEDDDAAALLFIEHKDSELEEAMAAGNA